MIRPLCVVAACLWYCAPAQGQVAVLRDTLRNSVGTDDFTISGLGASGNHKAVFLFGNVSGAGEDGTATNVASWAHGMAISSTDRAYNSSRVNNGATSTVEIHLSNDTLAWVRPGSSGAPSTANEVDFNSFITDGFRVDVDKASTKELFLHGVIFTGASVQAARYQPTCGITLNATTDVALSFTPDLFIVITDGDSYDGATTHTGFATTTIAFVKNNGDGTCNVAGQSIAHTHNDSGTANCYGTVSDSYMPFYDSNNTPANHDWEWGFTMPNQTTLRITCLKVGADAQEPEFSILAVDFGTGKVVQVGIMDTGTATGSRSLGDSDFAPDIEFTPSSIMFAVNQITAIETDVVAGAAAGTNGWAVCDGTRSFCVTQSMEQGVSTSNTQSLSDDQLFNVPDDDGGSTGDVLATFTSFGDGGLTANFTANGGSSYKWPFFAVGDEPAANGLLRTIILLSQFDRLHKQQTHFDRYGVYSISP